LKASARHVARRVDQRKLDESFLLTLRRVSPKHFRLTICDTGCTFSHEISFIRRFQIKHREQIAQNSGRFYRPVCGAWPNSACGIGLAMLTYGKRSFLKTILEMADRNADTLTMLSTVAS
jgi:hypothetical protein